MRVSAGRCPRRGARSDAAFGAVGSLLRSFEPDCEGGYTLDLALRVEPGSARVPRAPLP
ncbi:MAG: hypothetical protein ACREYA_02105 [Cupriavidus necator]